MNPVSDTAFLTCGARAADAKIAQSLCDDHYASLFMTEHGKQVYESFRLDDKPRASIVIRHRLIDDLLRARLAQNPETTVIIIGAGFDARAFRLPGGNWVEIDEPQVINLKNQVLPASQCRNPFQRIAIDFAHESLADKLPAVAPGTPVVVVMEGIFVYLEEQQARGNLRILKEAYPAHTLICDLCTRYFMERYGKGLTQRIEKLGAKLKFLPDDTTEIFIQAGYREGERISVVGKFMEHLGARFGLWLVSLLMPRLLSGNCLHVFEARA